MMPGRNSRRAYQDGREIEPMSLGNMRAQGVRSVWAECESCRHEAVNVDRFADAVYVPDVLSTYAAPSADRSGSRRGRIGRSI